MRTVYRVREYREIELPVDALMKGDRLELYPEVTGKGYLQASLHQDRLRFTAGGRLGLIPLNDRIALEVVPKVPIGHLMHILQISGWAPFPLERFLRKYESHEEPIDSLLDILAQSLVLTASDVLRLGLHQEYYERREDTSFPKGRILIGRSFQCAARGRHQLGIAWFDRTYDVGVNRVIKCALWGLARQYSTIVPRAGQRRLLTEMSRLYAALSRISLISNEAARGEARDILDVGQLPTHRRYYEPALALAWLVIFRESVEITKPDGRIPLPSLLVNMEDVFEGFVRALLRQGLEAVGVTVKDGNQGPPAGARKGVFAGSDAPIATPDVVISSGDEVVAIVEIKYKEIDGLAARDDLNQAITYGVSYGAPNVVIVHPALKPGSSGLETIGRVGSMAVHQYAFDLAGDLGKEQTEMLRHLQDVLIMQEPGREG